MFNPELGQLAIGKTERKERGRCCFAAKGRKMPVHLHDLQVQRIPRFTTLSHHACCPRRGNDSQEGVREVKKFLPETNVFDIVGGLHAWAKTVDNDFPIY